MVGPLRVIRTAEYRRTNWWHLLLAILDMPGRPEDEWHLVTVMTLEGQTVAIRRFEKRRHADRARRTFVALVAGMPEAWSPDADWQAALNSV